MNAKNIVGTIQAMADVAQQKRRKRELQRIWDLRLEDWNKDGDEMVALGVCTREQLNEALCWGE